MDENMPTIDLVNRAAEVLYETYGRLTGIPAPKYVDPTPETRLRIAEVWTGLRLATAALTILAERHSIPDPLKTALQ